MPRAILPPLARTSHQAMRPRLSFSRLWARASSTAWPDTLLVAGARKREKSGAVIASLGKICGLVLLLLCGPLQAGQYKGFPRGDALVSAAEVKSMQDAQDPKLVVLAAVPSVTWLLEHIPGALHTPRKAYTGKAGMAPERERFQEFARGLGIDNDSTIVVYDEGFDAARLWWLFRLYGKPDVRVLDGGLDAWKDTGYGVERGPGQAAEKTGNFTATPALAGWTADMADVYQGRSHAQTRVWDARSVAEWDGSRTIGGLLAGRIDGARYIGWKDFRKASEGRPAEFRNAAEIGALLKQAAFEPEHDHIFYCHSGARAATPLFALYLMGYPIEKLHLYDGSWIEWSQKVLQEGAEVP